MPHHLARLFIFLSVLVLLSACGTGSAANPTPTPRSASSTEPALAPPLPGAYAALGASETYGVGAVPHTRGYAYTVAQSLGARSFVDSGIPGTTLAAGYDTELVKALEIRPALCTVFFSINDLRAGVKRVSFLNDLQAFVATLRRAHSQVLIIGMPDLSLIPAVRAAGFQGLHQTSAAWNAGMQRIAKQTGSHFLDLSQFARELAAHPGYVAPDGLHPSNSGHRRLAGIVLNTIRRDHLWPAR